MIQTRPATPADIDTLLVNLNAGFDSFMDFAPAGWVPPEPDRELTLRILARPSTWALLATVDGEPAGHVSFNPARGEPFEDPEGWRDAPATPGQAHLWQLFVLPEHWGGGVAGSLHDAALAEMRPGRTTAPGCSRRRRMDGLAGSTSAADGTPAARWPTATSASSS